MIGHLDFYTKNQFRKYPLRDTSAYMTKGGIFLDTSLLVGASLMSIIGVSQIYISRIYVKNSYVSIIFSDIPQGTVGYATGTITQNNQSLTIVGYKPYFSGFIILGSKASWDKLNGSYELDNVNGRIEDSVVTLYPTPALTSINDLAGNILLSLTNIIKSESFNLAVEDVSQIASIHDHSTGANNCPTNIINAIGNVLPDNNGNIDIYGIEPVEITTAAGILQIGTPTLIVEDICPNVNVNIPPLLESNDYHGYDKNNQPTDTPLNAVEEEFRGLWPNYQP